METVPWVAIGSVGTGLATVGLIGYLYRHRGKPGANWLLLVLVGQATFCLSYGVSLQVFDSTLRMAFERLTWIGIAWTGPLFLAFALEYTGRGNPIRNPIFAPVVAVPILTTVLVVPSRYHSLLWSNAEIVPTLGAATVRYSFGPVAYLSILTVLITAGIGVLLLLETILSYGPLYRREAAAVALSTVPPATGLIIWLFELGPAPQLNLAPLLFGFHVVLDGYAFVGTNIFGSNPTTRRAAEQTAIDDLELPIVIMDSDHRIVDHNRAARPLFDTDDTGVIGESLSSVLGVDPENCGEGEVVTLPMAGRQHEFVLSCSPLADPRGTVVGKTVVFQDITRERQREQRLEVLNRVLRHNLRNEMTVIQGYAQVIENSPTDPEVSTWAANIDTGSQRLIDTGKKARDFEQVIKADPSPMAIDVAAFCGDLQSDLETRFQEATVETTVDLDEHHELYVDPKLLRLVVYNLLENALEHNGTDSPWAKLTVQSGPTETVEIVVEDNGAGIPASELTPLREGTESSLEHGSGIGLWIAHWGVRTLGGDIEFDAGPTGTTVFLSFTEGR
jgi:nitrogen-specific signal transduction histidine kinase